MIKRLFSLATLVLLAAACTDNIDSTFDGLRRLAQKDQDGTVFYATIEGSADSTATKVYADNQLRVLWNADDRVSIFSKNTYNQEYRFEGKDGDNAGSFKKVPTDDYITSNPLNNAYAVYPYQASTKISHDGVLTLSLPALQTFKQHSFGIGANTMVSVSNDNMLMFKNLGGYLSFKFYGNGVSVKSITLKGNNNEKIAGDVSVTMAIGGTPKAEMLGTATETITLDCASPVPLGNSESDFTEFWFVVPPTTFTGGFTVTVTDALGGTFEMKTTKERIIERNTLTRMSPVEVVPTATFVPFEDANFKAYCVENFDKDEDGEISIEEADLITVINVKMAASTNDSKIMSLQGIEFMKNLESLTCRGDYDYDSGHDTYHSISNGYMRELDVSNNLALTRLNCEGNQIEALDVSNNLLLTYLNCSGNNLSSLNVSQNTELETLRCGGNQIKELDISNNSKLTSLFCWFDPITEIDVSQNVELWYLGCYHTKLSSLDISKNINLKTLVCSGNNLSKLDIKSNVNLENVYCGANPKLTSLDLSKNDKLKLLCIDWNNFTTIDLSNNPLIEHFDCSENQLSSLDLSKNPNLSALYCYNNLITDLDISKNKALTTLHCSGNPIKKLDVSTNASLSELFCVSDQMEVLYVSTSQQIEGVTENRSESNIHPNTRIEALGDFTDPVFKAYMLEHYDTDEDGMISFAEAAAVESINIQTNDIVSLSGIEKCTNLRSLRCVGTDGNLGTGSLASLDVSKNTKLQELYVHNNKLKELNLSANSKIEQINAGGNPLTTFSTTGLSALKTLILENCTLTSVDLSGAPLLEEVNIIHNNVASIDLSESPKIQRIYARNSGLTSINLKNCPDLTVLELSETAISSLNLSAQANLTDLALNGVPIAFSDLPDLTRFDLVSLHMSGIARNMPADYLRNFPNLKWLNFWCYEGTSVDLSQNTKLESVWCGGMSNIEKVDLSKATYLKLLWIDNCPKLKKVYLKTGVQLTDIKKDDQTEFSYIDGDFLTVTPLSFDVASAGETIMVNVESNLDTLISINDASWISQTNVPDAAYGTVFFEIANNDGGKRSNTICISTVGGEFQRDIVVNQAGVISVQTGTATTGQTPKTASENIYFATVNGQLTDSGESYTANRYFYFSDTYSTLSELRMSGTRVNVDEKFSTKLDNLKENTTYYYVAGADITINNETTKYFGEVRSFKTPSYSISGCVDLDLPSGIKWGTKNLGATTSADVGTKYDWCKRASVLEESKAFKAGDILLLTDDHAQKELGGYWRTPTYAEWQELLKYCDVEYNSGKGLTIKSKTHPTRKIFIPSTTAYWTATCATAGYYTSTAYYMWPTAWVIDRYHTDPDGNGNYVTFSNSVTGGGTGYMARSIRPVYVDR